MCIKNDNPSKREMFLVSVINIKNNIKITKNCFRRNRIFTCKFKLAMNNFFLKCQIKKIK